MGPLPLEGIKREELLKIENLHLAEATGFTSPVCLSMDLDGWDERYRAHPGNGTPTPLLSRIASTLVPGRALDLACGAGRNALWLASRGWQVTAVDGSRAAIEILRQRAAEHSLTIDARVADLEKHEYTIQPDSWDLIAMCYYLQRDLFDPAKFGVVPGGIVLAIVHIPEPDDPAVNSKEPTPFRLAPGELTGYFPNFEILHRYEGPSGDPAHKRWVAEIAARRPALRS
jgi:tellurite methyltransferase